MKASKKIVLSAAVALAFTFSTGASAQTIDGFNKVSMSRYMTFVAEDYAMSAKADALPNGVNVPANIKRAADAEGKKQWGAKFVKSVFKTSKWKEFKNPKYPYQVRHRSMDVDFIVKEGSAYYVYHWVLKEGVSRGKGTGTFSIMARMKQPTREKVTY